LEFPPFLRAPFPRLYSSLSTIVRCDDPNLALPASADETFLRRRCYPAMTQPDIWYVTFGQDRAVKTDDRAMSTVRSTRTFKTEVDAKLFVMQILAKGWTASAGTLNPHQPKQIVGSSHIEKWADPGLGG
jgi:hypothetical protein